jgi:hypothetical protein
VIKGNVLRVSFDASARQETAGATRATAQAKAARL